MSAQPEFDKPYLCIEDYLAAELLSDTKHEYDDGEIVAMSGVSRNHERIKGNLSAALHGHLWGKSCEPFSSDVKLKVGNFLNVNVADLYERVENEDMQTYLIELQRQSLENQNAEPTT